MSPQHTPRLRAIQVGSYRCFEDEVRLELSPLTMLFGRNNAGKSALLRLLKIVADSLVPGASSPFELGNVAGNNATFLSAVSKFRPLKRLHFSLEWEDLDGQSFTDRYELKYVDEQDRVIVDTLQVIHSGNVECKIQARPTMDGHVYEMLQTGGNPQPLPLDFAGLVPEQSADHPLPDALTELAARITSLRGKVQWISSVRAHPERLIPKKGRSIRILSSDGREAFELLLSDKTVERTVASFYERSEIDRELHVPEVSPPHHRILLNPRQGQLKDVDLADTGEGMQHVFPVLVAAARAAQMGTGAVLAVEEPESHLHADAQRALSFHLAEQAALAAPPVVVVETHSRVLLLGLQLAVAKGLVPCDRVAIYWVDQEADGRSTAVKVDIDSKGRLGDGWPRSVLSEDRVLARSLLQQQRASERDAP